ncbi:GntR family transcriptional regulator [Petroclostridium xylanilyticum]|uniref:GntR family transcriptional regulator n=1 Tax=Petroclostridium xylanilyticum TaxID=1792311 RepID=UPI0018E2CB8C|nr:GntR family transcriptional regulator [Petroclostridium xylanilyticum]
MNLNIKPRNRGESTRTYIYNILKENIINLNLKPGATISEKDIADLLHVSRTPVREAFIQLTHQDLIETYPQKGSYVSLIDMDLVEQSRFMRETLETAVVKLAAEKLSSDVFFDLDKNLNMQNFCIKEKNYSQFVKYDDTFHELLFRGTKKERVWESIQYISAQFSRTRILRLSSIDVSMWDTFYQDHLAILNAIKERNPQKAEDTMKIHLTRVKFYTKDLMEKYPNYFK